MISSSILGYTEVKSPIIPDPITSPSATQSRGLLSTISGFLTRSPAAQTTSGPKDIPEPAGSPTPAIDPAKDNNDKMAATRKAVSKSAEPAEEDGEPEVAADEEDEDEDVPEEEYEVDKVLDHRQGPLTKFTYLVSWKGYGPEHNTWEPQDNLEHAKNLVSDYWHKRPKTELGVKKRGRQSTSSQPAARAVKAPRQSASSSKAPVRNGNQNATPKDEEEEEEDMGDDFVRTHVDSIDKYEDVKDWEKLVAEINTIERGSDNKLLVYMTMVGGERVAQPTTVAYARCPQKLLKFYEQHLKWRVAD